MTLNSSPSPEKVHSKRWLWRIVIIAALLLAAGAWFALSWARGPNGILAIKPAPPPRDFAAEFHEIGLKRAGISQASDNRWDLYSAALDAFRNANEAVPGAMVPGEGGALRIGNHFHEAIRFSKPPAPLTGEAADQSRKVSAEMKRLGVCTHLDKFAAGAAAAARPAPTCPILDQALPDLATARLLSRALAFEFTDAYRSGDEARATEALRCHIGLLRPTLPQVTCIGRLVGLAISTNLLTTLRGEITARRPTPATLVSWLRLIQEIELGDATAAIEGERRMALEAIQMKLPSPSPLRAFNAGDVCAAADRCYDSIVERASLPIGQRHGETGLALEAAHQQLSSQSKLIDILAPATGKYLQADDQAHIDLRGTIVMLAVETHIALRGTPPASLADIDPSIARDLPPDPLTNSPFVYRVQTSPSADDPRLYLLYSIGRDNTDDQGRENRISRMALSPSDGVRAEVIHGDFVFNHIDAGRSQ